jgi:GNAT superfamily N-acetyltransferase
MFTIRTATTADIECIIHHRREMFRAMGFLDQPALERMAATCRAYFSLALAEGSYRGWMAVSADGSIVGGGGIVVMVWPSNPRDPQTRRAMILNMYVEPEFRRRGIARALMQTMIDWCRVERFSTVELHASDDGRPLYESMGFRPTNEMRLAL